MLLNRDLVDRKVWDIRLLDHGTANAHDHSTNDDCGQTLGTTGDGRSSQKDGQASEIDDPEIEAVRRLSSQREDGEVGERIGQAYPR